MKITMQINICVAIMFLVGNAASADEQYGGKRTIISIGKHRGFVIEPKTKVPETNRPWVWAAPTRMELNSNRVHEWLFRRLLDRGFVIAGMDVGESHGNPAGRKLYSQFYNKIVGKYRLAPKACFLMRSRGGLMVYNWAAENPEKVKCIAGIYTVCDLRSWPGLEKAAPVYGLSVQELAAQLKRHNPIDRLEPLAKAGIPILHLHGDSDKTVPLSKNSQVLHDRYRSLGGQMELVVIQGKGHKIVREFYESTRMLEFLLSHSNLNR